MKNFARFVLPFVFLTGVAIAEEVAEAPKEGHSHAGESFNTGPRQGAVRIEGTGEVHFPVTTKWADGQAFFDQGIGQLHGFWYYEAERTFRQIAARDAECAMAYWGMSMANQSNKKRAKDFIDEAVELREKATERERLWIDARAKFLGDEPKDAKKRKRQLIRDLENIVHEFPDDIEAKAFLVVRIWEFSREGLPISSHQSVDALLDQIFEKSPMHPAHHYRIHLWDKEKAERALGSAAVLHETAPAIAHMWHMSGHIYDKLKRYPESAWHQEASARVDHRRQNEMRVLPDQIHNYAHNNEWYSRNLSHMGRVKEAVWFAKSMIDNPMHPTLNHYGKGGSSCSYGRKRLMEYLERFELWEQVLELADTHYLEPTDSEVEQIKRERLIGVAHYELGRAVDFGVVLGRLKERLANDEEAKKVASTAAREKAEGEKKEKKDVDKAGSDAAKKFKGRIDQGKRVVGEFEVYAKILAGGEEKPDPKALEKVKREKPALARLHLELGHTEKAIELAKAAKDAEKNRVEPLATYVSVLESAGKAEEAAAAFAELKGVGGFMDVDSEPFLRVAAVAKRLGEAEDWRVAAEMPEDFGDKGGLEELGPLVWEPWAAPGFDLASDAGERISLASFSGKPVLVMFYLGHGCKHCVEQLNEFAPEVEKFEAAGISVVAISPEEGLELAKAHTLCDGDGGEGFPFPLLGDTSMAAFRAYGAYDDFEEMALHGTFLIGPEGGVLWQDIGAEPFMEVEFLLEEAKRQLERRAK